MKATKNELFFSQASKDHLVKEKKNLCAVCHKCENVTIQKPQNPRNRHNRCNFLIYFYDWSSVVCKFLVIFIKDFEQFQKFENVFSHHKIDKNDWNAIENRSSHWNLQTNNQKLWLLSLKSSIFSMKIKIEINIDKFTRKARKAFAEVL